jgi:carbamate kinase
MAKKAVAAIGGNSITLPGQRGTIPEQFENTRRTSRHIAEMIRRGYDLVISHGNGPQVGNILLRAETASNILPMLPLDTCGADSQGGMGYMIQQVLSSELGRIRLHKTVVTVITQVVVDKDDPAFASPSKPIGPFYTREQAEERRKAEGWDIVEDAGRGFRRVVASPVPVRIVELEAIRSLIEAGCIVIAVGGGGIPVVEENGSLKGVSAVIDKDLASSLLGVGLGAELLLISTAVESIYLNFGKENQRALSKMTSAEAREYLDEGQFPPGSMGPKVQAALDFLDRGGKEVIVTSPEKIVSSLEGKSGTRIVP